MSYDLFLFRPKPNVDLLKTVEQLYENESEEINPGLPTGENEKQKHALAQTLINLNPQLEIFKFGFKEIADMEGITEGEARVKFRHLELNSADNGNGVQITLFDDTAEVSVPYWHNGDAAIQVFEEIWSYLKILEVQGNFATYDPQIEQILNLEKDFSLVLETYEGVAI